MPHCERLEVSIAFPGVPSETSKTPLFELLNEEDPELLQNRYGAVYSSRRRQHLLGCHGPRQSHRLCLCACLSQADRRFPPPCPPRLSSIWFVSGVFFSLSSSTVTSMGYVFSPIGATVPVSCIQSNRSSSFRCKLVRLLSRRTHQTRFQDQVPDCRGSVLSEVLFSARKTIAQRTSSCSWVSMRRMWSVACHPRSWTFRRRDWALPAVHGLDASASFTCEGNWNLYSGRRSLGSDLHTGCDWCHHGSVLVPSF